MLIKLRCVCLLPTELIEVLGLFNIEHCVTSIAFDAQDRIDLLLEVLLLQIMMIMGLFWLNSSSLLKIKNLGFGGGVIQVTEVLLLLFNDRLPDVLVLELWLQLLNMHVVYDSPLVVEYISVQHLLQLLLNL